MVIGPAVYLYKDIVQNENIEYLQIILAERIYK